MAYLIVFLGAGIGGVARYGISLLAVGMVDVAVFPYATLLINVSGSFLMGLIAEFFVVRTGLPQHLRLFLTTGILGGWILFRLVETPFMHLRSRWFPSPGAPTSEVTSS